MKLYRFKTHTTHYYFPKIDLGENFLYGLYSPFNGKLSRMYWYVFRKCNFIRRFTAVSISQLPFPYQEIINLIGDDAKMSFNMGSPGVEQKISILGIYKKNQIPFFAKFSQKSAARKLTINEIKIDQYLQDTQIVPKLYNFHIDKDFVFIQTEYISGSRPRSTKLDKKMINLSLELSQYQLSDLRTAKEGLITHLSHGDFCPWNMLEQDDQIRLIDWEMAADRPLGYDIFTYITQVSLLFHQDKTLTEAINENLEQINYYFSNFSIDNWEPYLHDFAIKRKEYEIGKGNVQHSKKYECIINYKKQ